MQDFGKLERFESYLRNSRPDEVLTTLSHITNPRNSIIARRIIDLQITDIDARNSEVRNLESQTERLLLVVISLL